MADRRHGHFPPPVPGGEVAGAVVLKELPADWGMHAWQALRSLLLWVNEAPEDGGDLFDAAGMLRWERELIQGAASEMDVRAPLAVIVGELRTGAAADPEILARACLCVVEWTLRQNARASAVAFAEAAALCVPHFPRYALIAGRLSRTCGMRDKAEQWLTRASEVARAEQDWETLALTLGSLGQLRGEAGDYEGAGAAHLRVVSVASRRKLTGREGAALHDLFFTTAQFGDPSAAEQYAMRAAEVYTTVEPGAHLPVLAHDVALFWMHVGQFQRALKVLLVLAESADRGSADRLLILGPAACASAMCGDETQYQALAREVQILVSSTVVSARGDGDALAGSALYLLGVAAWGLRRWPDAEELLRGAEAAARRSGDLDLLHHTTRAAEAVASRRRWEAPSTLRSGNDRRDALADGLIGALRLCSRVAYQPRRN